MKNFWIFALADQRYRTARTATLVLSSLCLAVSVAGAQSAGTAANSSGDRSELDLPAAGEVLLAASAPGFTNTPGSAEAPGPKCVAELGTPSSSSLLEASLPDAPVPQLHKLNTPPATTETAQHVAPLYTSSIPPGYQAQPLTVHNKIVLGVRDLYSFESIGAIVLSAGYSHVTDGQPNYGVNSKAFAQRLGAAAARETSQGVFSEIVLDPLLHEDPRYYVKGPSYNPIKRTLYAITRPLITRTDSGVPSINAALLGGYAGAAALTPLYYPQSNRNFHDVASTFGGSIGGAALGAFINEFADDVLTALHLKRLP